MTTRHSARGVLGGARTMRRHQRESRQERIARQKAEREERADARRIAAEEAAVEEEDGETQDVASQRTRKGENTMKREALRGARSPVAAHDPDDTIATALRGARSSVLPTMNSNRWTALIIWLVGAYLTRAFLLQIGVAEAVATPGAIVVQWLLTKAESPLWRGHGRPPVAVIATIIDAGMNAGGTWVYTRNIGATDFWAMIQFAAQDPTLTPSVATQIACAVGVGLLTAAAAEYYWNL